MSDSDALKASRRPDVVNVGYSTTKERKASDVIMFWMRTVERTRPLLLSIVMDGIEQWRKTARKQFRPFGIGDEAIDGIFRVFVQWAGPNPAEQYMILQGQMAAQEREAWDKRQSVSLATASILKKTKEEVEAWQREHKGRTH